MVSELNDKLDNAYDLVLISFATSTIHCICTHFAMSNHSPWCSLWLHCRYPGLSDKAKAGAIVFQVPDLLTEIISHCSWVSCVNLSHTTIHARIIVQASIWQQIHHLLKPFVKHSDLSVFFALLQETKAVIIGSTAWNVMIVDNVYPRDLNILVPNGSAHGIERLKAFLSCAGTTVAFDGLARIVYQNTTSRFIKLIQETVSHPPLIHQPN